VEVTGDVGLLSSIVPRCSKRAASVIENEYDRLRVQGGQHIRRNRDPRRSFVHLQ